MMREPETMYPSLQRYVGRGQPQARRERAGRRHRPSSVLLLLLPAACATILVASGSARAGTFTLNQSSCTLSAAVNTINAQVSNPTCGYTVGGSDFINVPSGPAFVSTAQVEIHRPVTIQRTGTGVSTLRGNLPSDTSFIR